MTTSTLPMPQCWEDFHDVLDAGTKNVILYGPPGTGKTYAGLHAGDVSAGAFRLVCTEEMTAADVVGHWMPSASGAWTWHTGSVIKGWDGDGYRGGRVVADEIDKANGDVLGMLLSMFDSQGSASWQDPATGRTLRPREGFSVVMTTNIEDMRELPTALKDRFPVAIRINAPHPQALEVLSEDLRHVAAQSADAPKDSRFSIRTFMEFDRLRSRLGDERAARLVFPHAADDILEAIEINAVVS